MNFADFETFQVALLGVACLTSPHALRPQRRSGVRMSATLRRLIDVLVAIVVVALALLGFSRPAQAYPPGTQLTLNIKSLERVGTGTDIEFIVRHARPGTNVKVKFEEVSKIKQANTQGIAVFSFDGPRTGIHLAAAYSGSERARTTVYLPAASLRLTKSEVGASNSVTVRYAKPGAVVSVKIGMRTVSKTANEDGVAVVSFKAPSSRIYSVLVFVGSERIASFTARTMS